MAKLPKRFNSDEHEEMGSFEALPADTYHVKVKGSEMKDTKVKIAAAEQGKKIKGSRLSITFEIVSGEYKGRLLFTNLNVENESEDTVEMAFREMTSISTACGKKTFDDSDELHGCELMMTVKIVPKSAQYPASNQATKYESLKGVAKPTKPGKKKGKKKPKVSFD